MTCPICGSESTKTFSSAWTFRCRDCDHRFSNLEPRVGEASAESTRADIEVKLALQPVRETTYRDALDLVERERPLAGARHLDVGCSIGQLLDVSSRRGAHVEGVEPEEAFRDLARERGHTVHAGYFPEAVGASPRFDLISFMDVAGHVPDLVPVGRSAIAHLAPGGRILVKTPAGDGFLLRVGRVLRALGVDLLWQRLWQVDFASPQIHFFTPRSMERFAQEIGGRVVASRRFPALQREGLWRRMLPGEKIALWKAIPIYAVLSVVLPIVNRLPQDSLLVVIAPQESADG